MKKHSLLFLAVITLILAPGFSDDSYAQSAQSNAPFVEGQIVVKADVASLSGYEILKVLPHSGLAVVRVERGREWAQVQRFKERGFKAGLNRIFMKSETPNDPLFAYQWHFKNVKAEEAWSISTGAGVTIAVLDTGLNNIGAEDGIGCVESGWDIVNDDNDPLDKDGHGTHVSGTIAQATNNEIGVAGLAYNACIMPVKVLDDNGSGTSADIAEGIYWAVDHGAQVINMSLGYNARYGMTNEESIDPALDDAFGAGVTVVCAAGNDGSRRNVSYPAIYPTTIAVGATDYSNQVTRYSNKGTGLDIVAPGGNLSADLNSDGYADGVLQETFVEEEFSYWFYQGTSMASPHVAAVAALLISNGTATTPEAIYNALTSTALDLGTKGYDSTSGYGLVQAYDALLYNEAPGDNPPTVTITSPSNNANFYMSDTINFIGIATDVEDDGLTNYIKWYLDGESNNFDTGSSTTLSGLSVGPHTITATVTDSGGNTASDFITINVDADTPPSSITATLFEAYTSERIAGGKNTFATATVIVHVEDGSSYPLINYTVQGQWSGAYNATATAVTNSSGNAEFTSGSVKYKNQTLTFVFDITNGNNLSVTLQYPQDLKD